MLNELTKIKDKIMSEHPMQPSLPPQKEAAPLQLSPEARAFWLDEESIPRTDELATEQFMQQRANGLRGAWQKAKEIAGTVKDHFAVEYRGYRLTPLENLQARLGNFAVVGKAINARSNEERRDILSNPGEHNPGVQRAWHRKQEREFRLTRSEDENFKDRTHLDTVKLAAHELIFMAPVRMLGLYAMHGAAKTVERISPNEKVATQVKERAAVRLAAHELGLHNPVMQRLQGMSRRDLSYKTLKRQHLEQQAEMTHAPRSPFEDD